VSKLMPKLDVYDAEKWLERPYCLKCGCRRVVPVEDDVVRSLLPPEAWECPECDAISWIEGVGELGIQVGCLFWGEE